MEKVSTDNFSEFCLKENREIDRTARGVGSRRFFVVVVNIGEIMTYMNADKRSRGEEKVDTSRERRQGRGLLEK